MSSPRALREENMWRTRHVMSTPARTLREMAPPTMQALRRRHAHTEGIEVVSVLDSHGK